MTIEELHQLVTEIAVKCNQLAQLQFTIASTVDEGFRAQLQNSTMLLAATQNLLETCRSHERRITGLEGAA